MDSFAPGGLQTSIHRNRQMDVAAVTSFGLKQLFTCWVHNRRPSVKFVPNFGNLLRWYTWPHYDFPTRDNGERLQLVDIQGYTAVRKKYAPFDLTTASLLSKSW